MNKIIQAEKLNIMKKILSVFVLAATMVACNSNTRTAGESTTVTPAPVVMPDTTGLAAYQQWKAQNELAQFAQYQQGTTSNPSGTSAPRKSSATRTRSSSGGAATSTSSNTGKASQKKGWSKAAKGAAIGGVAGAVGGAVINKKNRVAGGVIGGVLGAGVGYGIGRSMDKKDGRY